MSWARSAAVKTVQSKPWVGRCNRCGRVGVRSGPMPSKFKSKIRRCLHSASLVDDGRPAAACAGYLLGLKGEERSAAQAAYKIGGADAVYAMFAQEQQA